MDRTSRSRATRVLFALGFVGVLPVLAGCPEKKPTPVVIDAGPPPAPVDTTTTLTPMDDTLDAGDGDANDGAVKRPTGPAVNPNVARLKQCCNAIAAQAKANANSPEGQMMLTAAGQCSTAAAGLGPNSTAPEMATLRAMLVGHTLPAVCNGL